MLFYFSLFLFFFILLSCTDVCLKRRFVKKFGNVECYPKMPILGSAHYILISGLWNFLNTVSDKKTCLFWILAKPVYITKDPEELRTILTHKNTLGKASAYKFLEIINNSLLCCKVATWKIHRRLLNKCFNQKQIMEFEPIFNEFGNRLSQQFRPEMTTQEVGETLFKNSINNFHASIGNFGTKDFTSLVKNIISISTNEVISRITRRYCHPWLYPDFVYYKTEDGKKIREIMSKVYKTIKEILEQKQKYKSDSTLKYDFMQILLEEYETQERLDELILFTFASSETTTASMTASLLLLGMYQDIQEKVYQEIITIIGKNNTVESHHLSQFKYLHMFINESLRLFPSANYIGRRTSDDVDLGNGKIIPKGTDIFINIQNLHRDERLWKDPLRCIPERFLPENIEKRHSFTFLPFSYGPRNCIGMKYAEVVMKINLVKILSKFRIISNCNSVAEIKVPFMALSYIPGHFKLKFEQRCTSSSS